MCGNILLKKIPDLFLAGVEIGSEILYEHGLAMSYVFLGEASFVKSYGAKPMSIEWRLAEPIPSGLPKESRKLVG